MDQAHDITVDKALRAAHMHVGLVWWSFGMLLALGYAITSYRLFRGKVSEESMYGH